MSKVLKTLTKQSLSQEEEEECSLSRKSFLKLALFSGWWRVTGGVNTAAPCYGRCLICMCDCVDASLKGQRSQITAFYISNQIKLWHFKRFSGIQKAKEEARREKEKEVRSTPRVPGGASQKKHACVSGVSGSISEGFFWNLFSCREGGASLSIACHSWGVLGGDSFLWSFLMKSRGGGHHWRAKCDLVTDLITEQRKAITRKDQKLPTPLKAQQLCRKVISTQEDRCQVKT